MGIARFFFLKKKKKVVVNSNLNVVTRNYTHVFFSFFFQGSGGGYNGLSGIKMEQDGMASLGSMKVSPLFLTTIFP